MLVHFGHCKFVDLFEPQRPRFQRLFVAVRKCNEIIPKQTSARHRQSGIGFADECETLYLYFLILCSNCFSCTSFLL